ncbi:CHAD domain-containing protein [Acetobacteraceae bacterium H6797]|nr:CHAD domain-containing protein [Acetobacteraceae bacterium H6797]
MTIGNDTTPVLTEEPLSPQPEVPAVFIEFELPQASLAGLWRHRALKTKLGRPKRSDLELIWSDSADGRLLADGYMLEQENGDEKRLVPLLGSGFGPFRAASPLDAKEVGDLADGETLLPLAAFAGEKRTVSVSFEGSQVELELRDGLLRSVAAEAPTTRLRLKGETGGCLSLARALAADLPILPPIAEMAEAARALAHASPARPRRRGAPDVAGADLIGDALELAVGHLAMALHAQSALAKPNNGPEGAHQMRVAARRARSVIKVFRPVATSPLLDQVDAGLKAVASALGPARDWDVFIGGTLAETGAILGEDKRFTSLIRAAESKRAEGYAGLASVLAAPVYRHLLIDMVAVALGQWRKEAALPEMAEAPLEPFAAGILSKRWRRLSRDAENIDELPDEALHELRLKGKRLRYASELFAPLWPGKSTRHFLRALSALQEALGISNDTAVARGLVAQLAARDGGRAWACGVVEGYALARGSKARKLAIKAWHYFERHDPFWDAP